MAVSLDVPTATAPKHLGTVPPSGRPSGILTAGCKRPSDLPTHHSDRLASGQLPASIKIFLFFLHYLLDLLP